MHPPCPCSVVVSNYADLRAARDCGCLATLAVAAPLSGPEGEEQAVLTLTLGFANSSSLTHGCVLCWPAASSASTARAHI